MDSYFAKIPAQTCKQLQEFEQQLSREVGRPLTLIAYDLPVQPTPAFDDLQLRGPAENKPNIFGASENLLGNITQWHI